MPLLTIVAGRAPDPAVPRLTSDKRLPAFVTVRSRSSTLSALRPGRGTEEGSCSRVPIKNGTAHLSSAYLTKVTWLASCTFFGKKIRCLADYSTLIYWLGCRLVFQWRIIWYTVVFSIIIPEAFRQFAGFLVDYRLFLIFRFTPSYDFYRWKQSKSNVIPVYLCRFCSFVV